MSNIHLEFLLENYFKWSRLMEDNGFWENNYVIELVIYVGNSACLGETHNLVF